MEDLIPIINQIQDAFAKAQLPPLDLPQIAVVGSQSSGKSSVLENIVGRDFLPRGSGIVTRRPLILQLVSTKGGDEYGEFLHTDKKFYNFSEIREEIERETDRITGTNKGISDIPINLKIYSPKAINLTLVDLPGITKVAVGDQPSDIEKQIMALIKSYVSKSSCLILAVSPANADIANSDALALAKTVDPTGSRTIGVLTKLDLMDEGTNALDVLDGKVIPLHYGFIGVVNRSQRDIDSKKSIENALRSEEEYFKKHPIYASLLGKCGVPYLKVQLRTVLMDHIRSSVPNLRIELGNRLKENLAELQKLQKTCPELFEGQTKFSKQKLIMSTVNSYCQEVLELLNGRSNEISFSRLHGPARISYIFHQSFAENIRSRNLHEISLTNAEIMTVIQNVKGLRSGIFLPDSSFEIILKRHIASLEAPSVECVELVYEELQKLVKAVADKTMKRFPSLFQQILDVSISYLSQLKPLTIDQVKKIIQMETCYINIEHPDFNPSLQIRRIHQYFQDNGKGTGDGDMIFSKKVKNSNVDRNATIEGYMYKQGGIRKTWKKRYFRLIDFNLYFYNAIEDTKPKGQVKLKNCLMKEVTEDKGNGNVLKIIQIYRPDSKKLFRNHTVLNVYAAHASQHENWEKALSKAIDVIQRKKTRIMDPDGISVESEDESDGEFHGESLKRLPAVLQCQEQDIPPEMEVDITIIRVLLNSYFSIVRKSVQDLVPKVIMLMLVDPMKKGLADEVTSLFIGKKEEEILDLFSENPTLRNKKEALEKTNSILEEALYILGNLKISHPRNV